jgi:hypothetical protein
MNTTRLLLVVVPVLLAPAPLPAQGVSIRARLEARGLPARLTDQVAAIAASASAQGVPQGPLADKAIEGWAKRVPEARIVEAVRMFASRMAVAVRAVRGGGLATPPGQVVAAAAEAMGGGLDADQVRTIVRAAPSPTAAGPGLSVVAALKAQGLASNQAVAIVVGAMHNHRPVADLLDLPSVARSMRDQGMTASEVGQHILDGSGDGSGDGHDGSHGSWGDHPSGIPQGSGSGTGHDHQPGPSEFSRGLVRGL